MFVFPWKAGITDLKPVLGLQSRLCTGRILFTSRYPLHQKCMIWPRMLASEEWHPISVLEPDNEHAGRSSWEEACLGATLPDNTLQSRSGGKERTHLQKQSDMLVKHTLKFLPVEPLHS